MALTMAQPMRWVKLTLPPRVRLSWLLRIRRLTSSSLAGTSRNDVAVGTVSEVCMFSAMAAETPRIFWAPSGISTSTASLSSAVSLSLVAGAAACGAAVVAPLPCGAGRVAGIAPWGGT